MSNERQERDNDPRVSSSYRELATERSPKKLDDAILRKAHAATRPAYGRLRLWVRPLAWAATVAISLAIVLQVTQVPDPGTPVEEPRQPAAGRVASDAAENKDALVPASAEVLREADDMARMRSGAADEVALTATGPAQAFHEKQAAPRYCDEEARSTAASWIQCIEQLEADDKLVEARAERLVFEQAHPDY